MIFGRKGRLLETVHRVAALALAAVLTLGKLPVVRIGLVAVGAEVMRYGRLEISGSMAAVTVQVEVLSEQRVMRCRVIKLGRETRLLPRDGVVATFAVLLNRSAVDVVVARRALFKPQAGQLQRSTGDRRVALFARYPDM